MEQLDEKVYECTLAVEAYMICDLLARAGISARVDGEFLAGVAGELPLGSAVKVRVASDRAVEARAVIEEWEKSQPPEAAGQTAPPPRAPLRSPLWFLTGAVAGGLVAAWILRTPENRDGIDYDGDGDYESTFSYSGQAPRLAEYDRNNDGKIDARWHYDLQGYEERYEGDDDFDGRFEIEADVDAGQSRSARFDLDGDGRPEETQRYRHGVLDTAQLYDGSGRVVARETYRHGERVSAEFDRDGDGTFEQRVEFDRFDMPK
jgi:hypothetical protein